MARITHFSNEPMTSAHPPTLSLRERVRDCGAFAIMCAFLFVFAFAALCAWVFGTPTPPSEQSQPPPA